MLKNQIAVGGVYIAKVNNRLVPVRVDNIREFNPTFQRSSVLRPMRSQIRYEVTNLLTNRTTTFRSAAKFRRPATPTPTKSV